MIKTSSLRARELNPNYVVRDLEESTEPSPRVLQGGVEEGKTAASR